MRLLEAILDVNERWVRGDKNPTLDRAGHADSLPLVAFTCVDPRLNRFLPEAFGLEPSDIVILRMPGNIMGSPTGEVVRAIALACAVKRGKEIAVIGHTDCVTAKATVLNVTDAFASMGLTRDRLPDDLTDFFGLFASERQNVLRAVETLRQSPIIGPKLPVHGLLVDVHNGKTEWLVNGYHAETTSAAPKIGSELKLHARLGDSELVEARVQIPALAMGEMKFPELKIGEVTVSASMQQSLPAAEARKKAEASRKEPGHKPETHGTEWLDLLREIATQAVRVHIIGTDSKLYGPVPMAKLLEWVVEKRVGPDTPAQLEGTTAWQPLSLLVLSIKQGRLTRPPPIPRSKGGFKLFGPSRKT